MKKFNFPVQIQATREQVWKVLWDDATYRQWTVPFCEGSYAESDWKEGSKILFRGPGGDGMTSRIARLIPNEFMSFEHLGEIKNGVEDFETAKEKGWAGALENYTLREKEGGTELTVEVETDEAFGAFFLGAFPKAMQKIKELSEGGKKITPFLWFDGNAEEAARLYTSVFPDSRMGTVVRNGDAVLTVAFSIAGQSFAALNGGPMFKINPSISFYAIFETEGEVDAVWQKLVEGGSMMMPLEKYPWSEKYGWLQDRFGLTWQLSLGKIAEVGQRFTPSLLFVGEQHGRAEEALNFYMSIFKNSHVDGILRYGPGESDPAEGTVKHAQFSLGGQKFMVMDSSGAHQFQFNEAISFVIPCNTQDEIDYYWSKLSGEGGQESQCGWLKDKFGVSWQVVPPVLVKYLSDPNPVKANNVMQAMMKMKKIDIPALNQAYEQA